MIASSLNNYVWTQLRTDATLDAKYDSFRVTYGENFIPFFPVADNFAGNISWGSECYVLYDSLPTKSTRNVYNERTERIMYTIVGPVPDLFEFREKIVELFNDWDSTTFVGTGFRVNDVDIVSTSATTGRDSVRQLYSQSIMLEANYLKC